MNSDRQRFLDIFDSIDFNKIIDHPNILIASRFWEEERYCAAKTCYKFMRKIDDLIDDHKAANRIITAEKKKEFTKNVNDWLKMVLVSEDCNREGKELAEIVDRFRIPLWPLEAFAKSMFYDIDHNGFATLADFIEYSQGASVAPASIFVHLNGLVKKDGCYEGPAYNVRTAATPCALFSYIVHIIRDFQKDQHNNLNYFADELLNRHHLSRHDLTEISGGHPVNRNFREMISEYLVLADHYRKETYKIITKIRPLLETRYRLSLEIIFNLYQMVFERIDTKNGTFSTEELNPTPEETKERVYQTIIKFTNQG
jgi:phytoene/squalene synthetase